MRKILSDASGKHRRAHVPPVDHDVVLGRRLPDPLVHPSAHFGHPSDLRDTLRDARRRAAPPPPALRRSAGGTTSPRVEGRSASLGEHDRGRPFARSDARCGACAAVSPRYSEPESTWRYAELLRDPLRRGGLARRRRAVDRDDRADVAGHDAVTRARSAQNSGYETATQSRSSIAISLPGSAREDAERHRHAVIAVRRHRTAQHAATCRARRSRRAAPRHPRRAPAGCPRRRRCDRSP